MTNHTPATCTVTAAVKGACGAPAVWSNGTYAECAQHVADASSLSRSAPSSTAHRVGDKVEVERHGKRYIATVSHVGERGAVYADVTYGNGATRRVRV